MRLTKTSISMSNKSNRFLKKHELKSRFFERPLLDYIYLPEEY